MSIKFIQLPTCKLAEFVGSSATEFDVSGFLYNNGVTPVDPADIGDVCFATLEPKTAREELISFTIDSVTAGGVATITATRGLSQKSPYGTGGAAFDHQNGSDFVISNNPGLFNKLAAKANDETITGSWQFPAPSHVNNPATKTYTDTALATKVALTGDQTIAGEKTFSTAPKIPDSTAADEAITRGEFDDEAVALTGDQTVAGVKTFSSSPIVPTATSATQAVNKSQVEAYIAANSGDIKASDSAFGTVKLDVPADDVNEPIALSATENRVGALGGDGGTPSLSNPFRLKSQTFTAGETINGGTLPVPVFQNSSDNEFYACDANDTAKLKFQGFAISNSTNGNSIQIQFSGIVGGFTGLTEGANYYVQDAVGTIGTTPGTYGVLVGVAVSETQIHIQKSTRHIAGFGTFSASAGNVITCGFRPSKIKIHAFVDSSEYPNVFSEGTWIDGIYICQYRGEAGSGGGPYNWDTRTDAIAYIVTDLADADSHTVTITSVTSTGFTINNIKTNSPSNFRYFWEAEGDF